MDIWSNIRNNTIQNASWLNMKVLGDKIYVRGISFHTQIKVLQLKSLGYLEFAKMQLSYNFVSIGLINWVRNTYICAGKLDIIGSDNGLSPCRRQAIIWIIVGILSIRPLGTIFSEQKFKIHIFIHENGFETILREKAVV